MNILDFENDFECILTYEGDYVTDINLMQIMRTGFDANGNEILIKDEICLKREALESIRLGLEAMLIKFNHYLKKG